MSALAPSATQFERYHRHSLRNLCGAVFLVGGRIIPRVLTGTATIVEREAVDQILAFLKGAAPISILTTMVYGMVVAFAVQNNAPSSETFETVVLPQLGWISLQYVIPFAIANFAIMRGVVGMTADIASMRTSQEIDALESVGLRPAEAVFAPRALALIVTTPALAVVGVYASCFGAWMAAGTDFVGFVSVFAASITRLALFGVVLKLAITAFIVSIVSGYFGFIAARAEQGLVGKVTTSAVGTATISTVILNLVMSLLTAALYNWAGIEK